MKEYRIFYRTAGITTATTLLTVIRAESEEEALETFRTRHPGSNVVAIFRELKEA